MEVETLGRWGNPLRWGNPPVKIIPHPTHHLNVIKLKREIVWTGGLPYLNRLPHLPRAPHLHVNRTVKAVYSGKGKLPGLYVIAAIGVSKQWKGGHGSVQSYGSLTLFIRKGYLLFQWISIEAGHMGENADSFCAARKSYRTGLLFAHKNWCGCTIAVTERSCEVLISKVERYISDTFVPCFDTVSTPVRRRNIAEVNK